MYMLNKLRTKKVPLYSQMNLGKIISYENIGIVLNKDGSLMATIEYRGPDLDSSMEEILAVLTSQLNSLFMTLDTGFVFYFEMQRTPSLDYPKCDFPDEITKKIDLERRYLFKNLHKNYESRYFLTIYYMPPTDSEQKLKSFVIETKTKLRDFDDYLEFFKANVDKIYRMLLQLKIPFAKELSPDELASYLYSCVSAKKMNIHLPDRQNQHIKDENISLSKNPIHLDNLLYDSPLLSSLKPMLGNKHLRVITPLTFPNQTYFGFLDNLTYLNFSYRWVTRFYFLSRNDAMGELSSRSRDWKGNLKGWGAYVREALHIPDVQGGYNANAVEKVDEVENARLSVEKGEINYGYYTTVIVVTEKDEDLAEDYIDTIGDIFSTLGMKYKSEDLNAVEAWLMSIPGNVYANVRRYLISTGNLIHLSPITDVWAGDSENYHLKAPSLLYTKTKGNTLFRLNIHVKDVGHTILIGPPGSGKSVHLCIMAAQFRKYKNAKVFIFDKGASSRILTLGVGGNFFDLGANDIAFQPLSKITDEKERSWVLEWLCAFLVQENITITPKIKDTIWNTLTLIANTFPKNQLTMSTFVSSLTDETLIETFTQLTIKGSYKVFDANYDSLSFSDFQTFEMEKLMQMKTIVAPTLLYIFHRLEEVLDGSPGIIILDEAWVFLDNEAFSEKIREWLKVLRKMNVSVVFATQSLVDVTNSNIFHTVLDACQSKIFLANPAALEEANKKLYKSFGLNDRQIQIIAQAVATRDYYYTSVKGSRLYDLALGKFALSYVGVNKTDQNKCDEILKNYPKEEFNLHWQEYKGVKNFDFSERLSDFVE